MASHRGCIAGLPAAGPFDEGGIARPAAACPQVPASAMHLKQHVTYWITSPDGYAKDRESGSEQSPMSRVARSQGYHPVPFGLPGPGVFSGPTAVQPSSAPTSMFRRVSLTSSRSEVYFANTNSSVPHSRQRASADLLHCPRLPAGRCRSEKVCEGLPRCGTPVPTRTRAPSRPRASTQVRGAVPNTSRSPQTALAEPYKHVSPFGRPLFAPAMRHRSIPPPANRRSAGARRG